LTDDSTKAKWAQEGLPTDPLSVENGAIMTNAARWSLMIDPQLQVCGSGVEAGMGLAPPYASLHLGPQPGSKHPPNPPAIPSQGIKWIKKREAAAGLVVLQQSQPKYVDKVLACIEQVRGLGSASFKTWGLQGSDWAPTRPPPSHSAVVRIAPSPDPQGTPLLLENLPADLDAVLDPVLGKRTVKRGRALVMKVGDAEVEFDPNFRWVDGGAGPMFTLCGAAQISAKAAATGCWCCSCRMPFSRLR
jgi:dynein heavy chain